MLPLNVLLLSMAVAVFSRVSAAAPLEVEKEEVEIEAEEAEGELSEEEEDEDRSLDQTQAILIGQKPTTAPSRGSGSSGSAGSAGPGSTGDSSVGSSAGSVEASVEGPGSTGGSTGGSEGAPGGGTDGSAGSIAGPGGSPGSIAGREGPGGGLAADPSAPASDPSGFARDTNGNGHKFMNGAMADNTPITGQDPDPAAHDFLLSLLGGSDPFGQDIQMNQDQTSPPPQPHHTVRSSVTMAHDSGLDTGLPLPDSGPAPASALDLSSVSSSLGSAPSASDGPDSPDSLDYNGNGRLTLISQPQPAAVTERVSLAEVQTQDLPVSHDLPGQMEAVTSFPLDLTASGLGLGPDIITESSHVILHTESDQHSFTHLNSTVSGEFSQTEMVTVATETSTDSGATVTDMSQSQTQPDPGPGPATEHDYSQGSDGSENVELEDSC